MNALDVHLDVFEGPLDLLMHLIRKNNLDIYDIPIARITDQYLEHVHLLRELDPNLAGEFLVLAATLMEIKSRMLLPRHGPHIEGRHAVIGDHVGLDSPRNGVQTPSEAA